MLSGVPSVMSLLKAIIILELVIIVTLLSKIHWLRIPDWESNH